MDNPTKHRPATQADLVIYLSKLDKWADWLMRTDTTVTDRNKENTVAFLEGGGTINADY